MVGNMSEINPKNQQEAKRAQRGTDDDREEPTLFEMPPLKPVEPDHVVLDMPSVDDDFNGSDSETMVLDGVRDAMRAYDASTVPAPPRVTVRTHNATGTVNDDAELESGTGDSVAEEESTVVFHPSENAPEWHHSVFRKHKQRQEHHEHDEERARRHRRHVMIMRGVVTPALALLAVAAFVLGWLNMTIWKPNPNVSASSKVTTRYMVTDPGVLALADNTVSIQASGPAASSVCVAVASPRDAAGWLANQHYTRVTGLDTWQTFSNEQADGTTAGEQNGKAQIAFQQSDMWYAVQCGKGSATLKWKGDGGDKVVLIDLGSAEQNPTGTFSMAWTRAKVPDFATPCFFVGGLLVVMAVLTASLFAIEQHRRRNKRTIESQPVTVQTADEPKPDEPPAWMRPGSEPPAPSGRSRRRRHHSHTRRGREAAAEAAEEMRTEPEVSDATSVNLLQQSTPTVSSNELEEYFARLRAENAANAAGGSEDQSDGQTGDHAAEAESENHTDDADKEAK